MARAIGCPEVCDSHKFNCCSMSCRYDWPQWVLLVFPASLSMSTSTGARCPSNFILKALLNGCGVPIAMGTWIDNLADSRVC